MQNKNQNIKEVDSTVVGETESRQPNFSNILRLKEGEPLLVWSEGDRIRLKVVAIHF